MRKAQIGVYSRPEMVQGEEEATGETVDAVLRHLRFGQELRLLRGARKAEDVAAAAGISLWRYYRFERGDRRNINPSEILALARGLGVNPQVVMRLAQGAY